MQARHREAEGFALRAAAMVEPRLSSAAAEHITVWGGLVLWAMAAAAEGGRADADVAQAQADMRRYDAAAETLTQAHRLAPVWWPHQPPARSLVSDLAERQSRLSSTVRELVAALDGRR